MKDIRGNTIKKGDDVLVIDGKNKVPATILALSKDKIKLQLKEGKFVFYKKDVKVQKILLEVNERTSTKSLINEMLTGTLPVITLDKVGGVNLTSLRTMGVGFDKDASIGNNKEMKTANYGKIYRKLKEAFDVAVQDKDKQEIAEAISKIATYIKSKLDG